MAVLTIAKEVGSEGTLIGQSVAKSLNYDFISLKRIHDEAGKTGEQWERAMEDYEYGYTTLWEKYDWSFMGFVALSQSIILKYALKDNVVIMARGGNILLHDVPHSINIRVIAPFEKRVKTFAQKSGMAEESALPILKKRDKELLYAVNQMYGKKGNVQESFDVVFNTEKLNPEDVTSMLAAACTARNAYKTEESILKLQMKSLSYEVKAGIATNSHFFVPTLEVLPQGQGLFVRGVVGNIKKYKELQEEVLRLAGNVPVTFDLHFRGAF